MGNTWDLIFFYGEGYAFMDNGRVKILQPEEVLQSQIPVITAESGLLQSPKRTDTMLEFTMIFEPRITLKQILYLDSSVNSIFNGYYSVMGYTHKGMISPTVNGDCTSQVLLWRGSQALRVVSG